MAKLESTTRVIANLLFRCCRHRVGGIPKPETLSGIAATARLESTLRVIAFSPFGCCRHIAGISEFDRAKRSLPR
jgi:hypothetical protein